jgi:hypothetical protein
MSLRRYFSQPIQSSQMALPHRKNEKEINFPIALTYKKVRFINDV